MYVTMILPFIVFLMSLQFRFCIRWSSVHCHWHTPTDFAQHPVYSHFCAYFIYAKRFNLCGIMQFSLVLFRTLTCMRWRGGSRSALPSVAQCLALRRRSMPTESSSEYTSVFTAVIAWWPLPPANYVMVKQTELVSFPRTLTPCSIFRSSRLLPRFNFCLIHNYTTIVIPMRVPLFIK